MSNNHVNPCEDKCCPPLPAIFDPPQYIVNDYFHPQVQPIVHQIEVINQHHCVPVPEHLYTYKEKDIMCNVSSKRKSTKTSSKKRSR
ncbi:hypothetical protein [Paenibacillus nasutitermitis]|uniref:Spore coat protein D n=1 Tax=Paenibacillus nasutitermitis TaxID=1652958 RepID=A0A916Z316_9BACL|nr:hypothetical protein [Paenibacillus nasutitermitis]GGD73634.1 hypothetical protein GCM10010911_34360 [Paenibacillus nasutitermitis]